MKKRFYLSFVTIVIALSAFAQEYRISKIPDWVETTEIPDSENVSKYDVMEGYYLKLEEYQINLEANAVFNRQVRNVISYRGITNASQISVIYDTSYQKLTIHHLYQGNRV